jgi:hypothetical protein
VKVAAEPDPIIHGPSARVGRPPRPFQSARGPLRGPAIPADGPRKAPAVRLRLQPVRDGVMPTGHGERGFSGVNTVGVPMKSEPWGGFPPTSTYVENLYRGGPENRPSFSCGRTSYWQQLRSPVWGPKKDVRRVCEGGMGVWTSLFSDAVQGRDMCGSHHRDDLGLNGAIERRVPLC